MICLGTSGGSWWRENENGGDCWRATRDDLTDPGRALLDGLADLHGHEPVIVTFLDT